MEEYIQLLKGDTEFTDDESDNTVGKNHYANQNILF